MRGFLVLCLVAVAAADKLGYDYRPAGGVGFGVGVPNFGRSGGRKIGGSSFSSGGVGAGSNFGIGIGSGAGSNTVLQAPEPIVTEYNKEYYFHSAPEEDLNDGGASERIASSLKKNLRVIFIKAPENNRLTKAALQIAKQASEDRTAIYVLTKDNDISDLSQQLQQLQANRSQKPEVRFVKYRTPQDALNAQRAIQAQYDALGGSSKSSDEGVAPVLNYASSSPVGSIGSSPELSSAGSSSSGSVLAPSGSYIPPKNTYLPPVAF